MLAYPPFTDSGNATLLRGFGYQIATLKKPTLAAVQAIAEGIGMVVMRTQDYIEATRQLKEIVAITTDHILADQEIIDDSIGLVKKLQFILLSQQTDNAKLAAISQLVLDETV